MNDNDLGHERDGEGVPPVSPEEDLMMLGAFVDGELPAGERD